MTAALKTPVGRLLSQALELLETKGWCQRTMQSKDGRHCLVGALNAQPGWDYSLWVRAVDAFREVIGTPELTRWNDVPERKFPDVRRAFRRAIRLAEARGK